jgi:hypothetical protein
VVILRPHRHLLKAVFFLLMSSRLGGTNAQALTSLVLLPGAHSAVAQANEYLLPAVSAHSLIIYECLPQLRGGPISCLVQPTVLQLTARPRFAIWNSTSISIPMFPPCSRPRRLGTDLEFRTSCCRLVGRASWVCATHRFAQAGPKPARSYGAGPNSACTNGQMSCQQKPTDSRWSQIPAWLVDPCPDTSSVGSN